MPKTPGEALGLHTRYMELIDMAAKLLGSKASVERALGIGRNTLPYREQTPSSIRIEHLLAVEHLIYRIRGPADAARNARRVAAEHLRQQATQLEIG